MASWFKQTIVCPEASLSQDRRGTLSYPLIRSIMYLFYDLGEVNILMKSKAGPIFTRCYYKNQQIVGLQLQDVIYLSKTPTSCMAQSYFKMYTAKNDCQDCFQRNLF